jgi:hypothetical protein
MRNPINSRILYALAAVALLIVGQIFYARAESIPYPQVVQVQESALFSMPEVNAAQASTTPAKILADRSPALKTMYQRLLWTNLDATDTLCVFWLVAPGNCKMSGYDCNGAGTNDGIPIPAGRSWSTTIAGNLTICAVGSASPTAFHVARAEVP